VVRIELLHVPDCPSLERVRDRLRAALGAAPVDATVEEVEIATVESAAATGMHGSPTILVDGVDVFLPPSSAQPSMSCRFFETPNGIDGSPTVAQLVDALSRTRSLSIMRCSCCDNDRDRVVGLRCHDDVRICRECIGWLRARAGLVDATAILPVADMRSAIAFYETAGFQVREYEGGGYAFVHYDDESVFDLGVVDRPAAAGASESTCYLTVSDIDAWHARLHTAGLAVSELDDKPWGMREFTITDRDGNCLRIGQPSS
jgi:predicted enzyme related to lactoylglutathione lyase